MEMGVFTPKLNFVDGKVYSIEEQVTMPESGVYEAELQHDNIDESTLRVYTGPQMTGDLVQTFTLSTPSLTPWKRIIRIHSAEPAVYISYQTEGDTVEADDVNRLQDEIYRTQSAVNTAERRVEEVKAGLEEEMQGLEENFQEITKPEIDALDDIEGFEPGEGGGGCACSALTEEEIDAVTPGGGIPQFAYDPLTVEEIEEATQ